LWQPVPPRRSCTTSNAPTTCGTRRTPCRLTNSLPSLVIVGGGPIGCELSEVYARFGTTVTIVEAGDTLLKEVEPEISRAIQNNLEALGITVLMSAALSAITEADTGYLVHIEGRQPIPCDRVLVAIGKTPRLEGIGLETLGLDPTDVMVDDAGRLGGVDRVWGVGDVTGLAPYTHGANAQASVVVGNITGGTRSVRAAVMPRCVYTHPPVAAVGPTSSKAAEHVELAVVRVSYGDIARPTTDELGDGLLTVFADRATGSVVGASGIGRSMDEIISLITLAMETGWPARRLQHVVQPFPTISQLVGHAFEKLARELGEPEATEYSRTNAIRTDPKTGPASACCQLAAPTGFEPVPPP
jgi:pyruvate/2-oxoglutarate dehydrogenase complex dihydrolipoamide dehydrogenase (E3) component